MTIISVSETTEPSKPLALDQNPNQPGVSKKQRRAARRAFRRAKLAKVKSERPFVPYNEYINSDAWREKRAKVINKRRRRGVPMCSVCYAYGPLHAHHKTYARLGDEYTSDLAGVCASCHELIHWTPDAHGPTPRLPRGIVKLTRDWISRCSRDHLWKFRRFNPSKFAKLAREHFEFGLIRYYGNKLNVKHYTPPQL